MKVNRDVFARHVRVFSPGQFVFREKDLGMEMYVIIEGKVEIRKSTSGDSSKTLIVLNKGDIFGEMAIIEKKRRSASAVAVMKTKLLVLNEKLFDATIEGNPDFARKMIKIFSERLRKTNATLQEVLASNHQNQVLTGLVQYASEHGITTFKGRRIHIEHFVEWASGHIGITEKEIRPIIRDFLKREVLTPSARSSEEVLFQPR